MPETFSSHEIEQIQSFLNGRLWHREHIPFAREQIDSLIEHNKITIHKGIQRNRCIRCGNKKLTSFQCAKCNSTCHYCRHCIKMGRISSCAELITWNAEQPYFPTKHKFAWAGTLTSDQQRANNELSDAIRQNHSHLIHAVCGAGKTEILFQPIHSLLIEGKRVCVATPRTDVVLELFPRFQKVFPETIIHAYYGNAPKQEGLAQLVLATTHQLYRFKQAFDVIFVDEADAFPYTFDETLQFAVNEAIKPNRAIHFITATPSRKLRKQVKSISTIDKRFHGHPLPVPKYESLFSYKKSLEKGLLPNKLEHWIQQKCAQNVPFFVFFPSVELLEKSRTWIQQQSAKIETVHAEDPNRKEKVLQMRNGELAGLFTTTILERGVTIPNVHVAVVGSESQIFTSSALIQISGRVGRSHEFPTGEIVFFHDGITFAMDGSCRAIKQHNRRGGFDKK